MAISRICTGNERGDLELEKNNYTKSEDGKRCYSCGQNLGHYMGEYCSNGTIHGVRFFGENRTFIEKIWWAISITLSVYFCVSLIKNAYDKWENSPVIVSFATKETPAWMVPFPAVTICPESKARSSVFNYTYYLHKKQNNETLTEEEERKFGYMSFICDTKFHLKYKSGKFADERMFDFFDEVQPRIYEDVFDCKYLGKKYNCSDLFSPIITDDGICYTFNIMDRTQILSDIVVHYKDFHKTNVSYDWNIEHGFNESAGLDTYPRRALVAGVPYGLEIKMKVRMDDLDHTCGTSLKGFKVQIAYPQRMPRVQQQHFIVPLEIVAKAAIAPEMITTSEAVKLYKPERRNCYFPSEHPLKYFKVYSQDNCAIECRGNFTLQECGCVNFYVPREADVPMCGAESYECVRAAVRQILRGGLEKKINAVRKVKAPDDKHIPTCSCLPICTSMNYQIESTQARWDWRTQYEYNPDPNVNISEKNIRMSMLQVFFKANQFITSERNELYGATDFVANVGGLMGLFIGFSALSLVEIIYYLTLRIICNISMFGKGNWSGKTN